MTTSCVPVAGASRIKDAVWSSFAAPTSIEFFRVIETPLYVALVGARLPAADNSAVAPTKRNGFVPVMVCEMVSVVPATDPSVAASKAIAIHLFYRTIVESERMNWPPRERKFSSFSMMIFA